MEDGRGKHPNSIKNRFKIGHMTRNCVICGKEFYFPPAYIGTNKGKTCSHKCRGINMTGKPVPNRRTGKYISCKVCKKMFYTTKSDTDRKYCSKKCFGADPNKPKGKDRHNWQGGRILDDRGYILLYTLNYPHPSKGGKTPYVYEHRLVMEKHIGRYLTPQEKVHHINGIKTDNRIENLMIVGNPHLGKIKCPYCQKEFLIQ